MSLFSDSLWTPSGSLLEIVLRGTIIYLGLICLFRFLRRDAGGLSLADLLLVVLISDASQNGMSGEYRSLTEAAVLVGTIAGWSYLLDWLSFRSAWVERLLQPKPLTLVRDGVIQRRNMRRELITLEELESQMRLQGIEHLDDVQCCYLEPDGQISIIPRKKPARARKSAKSAD